MMMVMIIIIITEIILKTVGARLRSESLSISQGGLSFILWNSRA